VPTSACARRRPPARAAPPAPLPAGGGRARRPLPAPVLGAVRRGGWPTRHRAPPPPAGLPTNQDDAADARWFPVGGLPPLAFDHKLVVRSALRRLAALPEAAGAAGRGGFVKGGGARRRLLRLSSCCQQWWPLNALALRNRMVDPARPRPTPVHCLLPPQNPNLGGLAVALSEAADKLEGPWTPPSE
jgi:hypothetical protein